MVETGRRIFDSNTKLGMLKKQIDEKSAKDRTRLETDLTCRNGIVPVELLMRMRDAGIKGSRGKLAQLTAELQELTVQFVEHPLQQAPRAGFCVARAEALVACLRDDADVLAYRFGTASAEILAQLNSGEAYALFFSSLLLFIH